MGKSVSKASGPSLRASLLVVMPEVPVTAVELPVEPDAAPVVDYQCN